MRLFSIVIPTYNRAHLIANTLDSVLGQRYENFEVIIVDDGSRDNTEEVVTGFKDKRIRYFKKQNGERGAARNFGANIAKGEYITFMDSDDTVYPNHLEEANGLIEAQKPEVFALSYDIKTPDGTFIKNFILPPSSANKGLLNGNILSCNGVFVKRTTALQFRFDEDRKFAGTEDWALWLRLAARFPVSTSPVITSTIIDHDNRSVHVFKEDSLIYRASHLYKILKEDEVFVSRFGKSQAKKILAHMYSYGALHLALSDQTGRSFKWLWEAVKVNPLEIFSKRFVVILKISMLPSRKQ